MRPPCSTIGTDRNLVGIENGKLTVVVLQAVGTRQGAGGNDGNNNTVRCVSSGIMEKCVTYGEQDSLIVESVFDFVNLAAFLVCRNEVLAPVLNPFYGSTQLNSSKGCQDFFRIEEHNFWAEATTNIGSYHPHFVFGEVKNSSQTVAYGNRSLCRYPTGKCPFVSFPARQDAPALHRHGGSTFHSKSLADDMRRMCEHAIGVTNALHKVSSNVAGDVSVDEESVFCRCNFKAVYNR